MVTPSSSISELDAATKEMAKLSLDSEATTKKVQKRTFSGLPHQLKVHIAKFLPADDMQHFLQVERGCLQTGADCLRGNNDAVSDILRRFGSVGNTPYPLSKKVVEVALSISEIDLVERRDFINIQEIGAIFKKLIRLKCSGDHHETLPQLGFLPAFKKLRAFDMVRSVICYNRAICFAEIPDLQALELRQCHIDPKSLGYIATQPKLTKLCIDDSVVHDPNDYGYLPHRQSLKELYLAGTNISDVRILYLVKLKKLTILDLRSCNRLTSEGIRHFFQHLAQRDVPLKEVSEQGAHESLRELDLSCTNADDTSLQYADRLQSLQILVLSGCSKITREGCKQLTRLQSFDDLLLAAKMDEPFKLRLRLFLTSFLNPCILTTKEGFEVLLKAFESGGSDSGIINALRNRFLRLQLNRFNVEDMQTILQVLDPIKNANISTLGTSEISAILSLAAKYGLKEWKITFQAVNVVKRRGLGRFEPDQIGQILAAHVTLGFADKFCDNCEYEIQTRKFSEYPAQAIAKILRALIFIKVRSDVFRQFAEEMKKRDLKNFSAQDFSDILWAFSQRRIADKELFQLFANEIEKRDLKDFKLSEIVDIIKACAAAGCRCEKLFELFANEIQQRDFNQLTTQEIEHILGSYSDLGIQNKTLFQLVANEIEKRGLESFNRQEIANIFVLLVAFGFRDKSLMELFIREIEKRGLLNFSVNAIENIFWSLAKTHLYSKLLFDEFSNAIEQMHFDRFTSHGLSQISLAYATFQIADKKLFEALSKEIQKRKGVGLTPHQKEKIRWVYEKLQFQEIMPFQTQQ